MEGAGFEVTNIVDEPIAAAAVLKITDGAVVDVGRRHSRHQHPQGWQVIYTDDEAPGQPYDLMTAPVITGFPTKRLEVLKTTPKKRRKFFRLLRQRLKNGIHYQNF